MSSQHHHGSHRNHSEGFSLKPDSPKLERPSKLLWAIGITGSILVLEAVGGILSGSIALLSDAGHMLTDLAALFISLTAMLMSQKPANSKHTYGLARLEVLAALGNAFTFFLMVLGIAWEAILRLFHPSLPQWKTMGIIALIGFLANALSAWFLHGSEKKDLNLQSAWIHVLGDLVSSIGLLVGVVVIAETGWAWVDAVISLGIALLIALSTFKLFRKALNILLESAPQGLTPENITRTLKAEIPEILEIHHIHLWEVGSGEIQLTAHLVVKDQSLQEAQKILEKSSTFLKNRCGIDHSTFQIEAPVQIRMKGP